MLQELLSPSWVDFLDLNWLKIGNKESLEDSINAATGIPPSVLRFNQAISQASVAQKMAWVAKRQTTRVEDIAYSLLGIFDISMPFIYEEGAKAFTRLQLEIMKVSADHSLFAWTAPMAAVGLTTGPLAVSPVDFNHCRDITSLPPDTFLPSDTLPLSYEMTNRGLRSRYFAAYFNTSSSSYLIRSLALLQLVYLSKITDDSDHKVAILNFCKLSFLNHSDLGLGIYLRKISWGVYVRSHPELLFETEDLGMFKTNTTDSKPLHTIIYITEPPTDFLSYQKMRFHDPIRVNIEFSAA